MEIGFGFNTPPKVKRMPKPAVGLLSHYRQAAENAEEKMHYNMARRWNNLANLGIHLMQDGIQHARHLRHQIRKHPFYKHIDDIHINIDFQA